MFPPSCSSSKEQPPSKAVKRANLTPPLISAAWGGKRELCLHGCLDLNGNVHTASPSDVDPWEGPEARPAHGEYEAACKGLKSGSEESQHSISPGRRKTQCYLYCLGQSGGGLGHMYLNLTKRDFFSFKSEFRFFFILTFSRNSEFNLKL